jgi:hypothetical protein
VHRLEAAFRGTRPQRSPGPRRIGDASEVLGPEILKVEEIAKEPSGAFGDNEHVWLGHPLQSRRQVRRLEGEPLRAAAPETVEERARHQTRPLASVRQLSYRCRKLAEA